MDYIYNDYMNDINDYRDENDDHRNDSSKSDYEEKDKCREKCYREQTHTHEFLGSTKLAEECDERHNHRFAGVTGEAIPRGKSHVHKIRVRTDFFDHFHGVCVVTGAAIPVGNGKHVHLATGMTTLEDGHRHDFIFATLIESPLV